MKTIFKTITLLLLIVLSFGLGAAAVYIIENGFHKVVPPIDFNDFELKSFAEKAVIIDDYISSHWFAFPSVVIAHAFAPFVSTLVFVKGFNSLNTLLQTNFRSWYFALPMILLWLIVDLGMGLIIVPVGPKLAVVDAAVSLVFGGLAFSIAGGFRKHEGPASVTSDEDVYRG
ncbi:hypothetical protein N9K91_00185 [Schleiferiaceae bacterium]|nr:hypothetical protein [Schleiferiaceae bacterium]